MPQIMPIEELRNTNEISDRCHAKRDPIFITKNGYLDLVLMSIETYEDLIAGVETDLAIAEVEAQIEKGEELLDPADVFKAARRKQWEVYSDIEISEEQIKQGKMKDARKALRSVREKSTAKIYINESGVRD